MLPPPLTFRPSRENSELVQISEASRKERPQVLIPPLGGVTWRQKPPFACRRSRVVALRGAGPLSFWRRCDVVWGTCAVNRASMRSNGAGINPFSTPAPRIPSTCASTSERTFPRVFVLPARLVFVGGDAFKGFCRGREPPVGKSRVARFSVCTETTILEWRSIVGEL